MAILTSALSFTLWKTTTTRWADTNTLKLSRQTLLIQQRSRSRRKEARCKLTTSTTHLSLEAAAPGGDEGVELPALAGPLGEPLGGLLLGGVHSYEGRLPGREESVKHTEPRPVSSPRYPDSLGYFSAPEETTSVDTPRVTLKSHPARGIDGPVPFDGDRGVESRLAMSSPPHTVREEMHHYLLRCSLTAWTKYKYAGRVGGEG